MTPSGIRILIVRGKINNQNKINYEEYSDAHPGCLSVDKK